MSILGYSPLDLSSELAPGQKLKASDLDFYALLRRHSGEGKLYFNQRRAVLFDTAAIGTLRKQLITTLGLDAAMGVLLRFGYTHGYQDAEILYQSQDWASDEDWLTAGPTLHTLAGGAKVETQQIEFNRATGEFYMRGVWHNSYEAEEHLRLFGPSNQPVCATLSGYASGYASRFFGQKLLAIETTCIGMGHSHCTWEIKPVAHWGSMADTYLYMMQLSTGTLHQHLAEFSSFIQNSRVVLFKWRASPGWPVDYVSDNVAQFNLDAKTLTAPDFLYISIIHPDDQAATQKLAQTNLENNIDHFQHDYRIIDQAGHIRWLSTYVSAERDPLGPITHYIGLNLEITPRKNMEEELRKLSLAVEQSANTVVITDVSGRIEYVNPRFVETTGYSAAEAIGQHTRLLKSGETSDEEYKRMWQTIAAGQEWRGEFHNKKKNGQLYWEKALISPIKNERGETTHFLAVKEEITAQRQAELALARRITELETVSKVGAAVSTVLDVQELLQLVANLTRDSFNLYHVNIFLVDESGHALGLAAGSGDIGQQLLNRNQRILFEDQSSAIARVARLRQGAIINRVKAEPDYQPDPLLPDAGSELIIPIVANDVLFGVLSVQADEEGHFVSDDLRVYGTLTNQIAVAIRNARLYENATHAQRESEERLRETQILQQFTESLAGVQRVSETINTFLSTSTRLLGFDFAIFSLVDEVPQRVKAIAGINVSADHLKRANHPLDSSDIMADIVRTGKAEIINGWDPRFDANNFQTENMAAWGTRVFMPITLRGQNIGLIEVGFNERLTEKLQEYQVRLLQSLVSQTAVALESAQRYEAIERAARREQRLREVTAKIRNTADVQSVMRVAAQEVGRVLGRPSFVQLGQEGLGQEEEA